MKKLSNSYKKTFFDEIAKEWDDIVSHDRTKLDSIIKILSLCPGQTVLDIGTGTGVTIPYIHRYITEKGRIFALDYSANMINVAKSKHPPDKYPNVEFLIEDVNDILPKNEYDAIVCYSCFPHFADQRAVIQHLSRSLRKKGKLMIAHSQSRDEINKLHRGEEEAVCDDHLPPMSEIREMVVSAELEVIEEIDNDEMFVMVAQLQG